MTAEPAPVIYTIGHSNVATEHLVQVLVDAGIDVLVDVRSSPFSRYAPQFNEPELRSAAKAAGIGYVPMGANLGGRPADPALYDAEGHVDYERVAQQPFFRRGIARLLDGIKTHRVAILCSEENPTDCHRRLLVGRVLDGHGVGVVHLRGDGRLQPETEGFGIEPDDPAKQLDMGMAPPSKEKPWRSIRSVSRSGRPLTSSEPSGEWEPDD